MSEAEAEENDGHDRSDSLDIESQSPTGKAEGRYHGLETTAVVDEDEGDEKMGDPKKPRDVQWNKSSVHLHSPDRRFVKRRRISLSPELDTQSTPEQRSLDDEATDSTEQQHQEMVTPTTSRFTRHGDNDHTEDDEEQEDTDDSASSSQSTEDFRIAKTNDPSRHGISNQPTFLNAPKFKSTSPETKDALLLPAYFSPQRKGAKFLPRGLAATLQAQLSQVKGWDGTDEVHRKEEKDSASLTGVTAATGLRVEQVRPGTRMYLVLAKAWIEQTHDGRSGNEEDGEVMRVILAGEGTLSGLGRRAEVRVGSKVLVRRPVWDVKLEEEVWTVACDWAVE